MKPVAKKPSRTDLPQAPAKPMAWPVRKQDYELQEVIGKSASPPSCIPCGHLGRACVDVSCLDSI